MTGLVKAVVPQTNLNATVVEDELDPTGKTKFQTTGNFRYIRRDTRFSDNDYYYSRQDGSIASWTVNGLTPGEAYHIAASWAGAEYAATNAPFRVYAGGSKRLEVFVDQTRPANGFEDRGVMWQTLGSIILPAGATSLVVELSDDANGYVQADAIHVVQLQTGEIAVFELPATGSPKALVDAQSVVNFGYTELFPTAADAGDQDLPGASTRGREP